MNTQELYNALSSVLTNPWTIGIGGGILSGLVVAWASQKIFSQREDKEYTQKVSSANQDVLYSLRPLISEARFPSTAILDSLVSATSRKYKIDRKDMSTSAQFFDDLIKEVMDSSFIPHNKKSLFCLRLIKIRDQSAPKDDSRTRTTDVEVRKTYRNRYLSILSTSMGMMVTTVTFLLTISELESTPRVSSDFSNVIIPAFAAVIVSLFGVIFMSLKNKNGKLLIERVFQEIGRFLP